MNAPGMGGVGGGAKGPGDGDIQFLQSTRLASCPTPVMRAGLGFGDTPRALANIFVEPVSYNSSNYYSNELTIEIHENRAGTSS